MKLHTTLLPHEIHMALILAKQAENVTEDIEFVQFGFENSRSHDNGYLIQLGTYDKTTGPTRSRHYKNTGNAGASSGWITYGNPIWAATYDEWGWFMAEIFRLDQFALWGNFKHGYNGVDDFNEKTDHKFILPYPAPEPKIG